MTLLRASALAALLLVLSACGSGGSSGPGATRNPHPGVALAGVGRLPSPASAWPAAGHDARHSSGTAAVGPQSAHVRWRRDLGGDVTPGPVLAADGTVLAATNAGVLHDLDAATGKDVWTFDGGGGYGSDLSTSPAVVAGGTILWPGPSDTLYALSPSGTRLWSEKFDGQPLSPAVAGRNRVYVSDLDGHLTALAVTGTSHRRLWTVELGGLDYASATVGPDGTIYTASDDDLVAVRDRGATGAVLWRFHARKTVEVSNGIAPDGTVVLGTNGDREYGITPNGDVTWSFDVGDYTYSSSVVRPDGTAYFGDNTGRLWIADSADGDVSRKITPLGDGHEKVWDSPAVDARGDVYWGTTEGNVYGYTSAGRQLFRLPVGAGVNSYPAIGGDGTLYLGTTDGAFYAIG